MDDKVEIKDLTQGEPTNTDWLIYQSSSDDEVYKAPKSDVEGEDAYVYIAYADDEDGNGFTNTFSETKDYVAILSTNTEIPSPAASDFSGLWKNYKGEKGNAATATAGTTTTLSAGQSAKVTNVGSTSSAVFKFEIPRGDKGEKGDNGAKIITAEFVGNDLHFNLDDGTEAILVGAKVDLKGIQGNTGASVVDAEVSGDDIVFTKSDGTTIKIENILIELKGDTGNGISGIEKTSTVGLVDTYTITYDDETTKTFDVTNGAKGNTGDNATVDAGTTTTGEAGTEASVVNAGTTSDAIFDFTIPKGDKGDTGNGIASIAKTGTSSLTDTYTITFTDETTTTFDVVNGEKGDNAYIYIAYASDDSGADFTTTFNSALDYVAILATYTEIETPEASDFAGLWKKYKGEKGDTGERGLNWINEEYSGATTYNVDDALLYNGSSYRCILESTGNLPTNTTHWSIIAQKGVDGEGSGDMVASVYDPRSISGDAFDMDNMVEGTNNKLVSSAEKTAWNDKLDDITGESIADLSDVDAIAGITDGKVLKWSTDKFVVADDDDTTYTASDFDIKDLTDSTNLMTTWSGKQDSLGFTPENSANKKTDLTGNSDTYYPTQKAVKTYADGKVYNGIRNGTTTSAPSEDAVYDALAGKQATLTFGIANTNAVKIDHASVVDNDYARFTASGLEGRSASEVRSDIGAQATLGYTAENSANKKTSLTDNSDTYYPTQKAVKTAVDAKQDGLVSGTNIKTINSQSLLGSGNIDTPNTTYSATDFDIKDLTDSTNLRTTWSGKQDALSFTPEDVANKKTSLADNSDTFYPTQKAVKTAVDAKQDALSFTPEDVANKRTSFQATPDDTHYPSEKLVKESLDAKANANNVLALDNTTAFTPDNDYEPATKKYVDDNAGGTKAIFEDETITPTAFGWGLSTASYDSVNFSVSSQDGTPFGVAFKPDGTKMYIMGLTNKKVFQYTLSTAWNVSTASYDSVNFSVSSQDTSPHGVAFKPDGTKMYVLGDTNNKVFQYTLSTAWDLSTASYDSVDFSVSSQETDPRGFAFKPDGTKMYVLGDTNKKVYQYTLSTAWDLSTASYDSVNFSVSSQDGGSVGVTFKPDGTKMYIVGVINDKVYQYTTTAYYLSLAEIDTDTYGEYYLTAIANNTKISIKGTPTLGQTLFVGLKDSGSAKTLTWDEINALGVTLPTQTTAGKQHIIEIKYIGSAWRAISVGKEV